MAARNTNSNGDEKEPETVDVATRVIERMTVKAEERLKDAERRKEEAREHMDPRESVATFHSTSAKAREEWHLELNQLCSVAGLSQQEVKAAIDSLAAQLQGLEGQLAQASYFLPGYDQRSTKATNKEMQIALDEARAKLIPKKKFSFGSKVARKKAADVADATTAAALTAPATASSEGVVKAPEVKPGRGIQGLSNRTVVVTAEQLGGSDFTLVDLKDCTVFLLGRMSALRCHRLTRCRLFSGPVTGSSFLDAVHDSLLHLPSHQVRIHSTHDTDFYLRVRSNPIIEHSSALRFAPCTFEAWPCSQQLLSDAGLTADDNAVVEKWQHVDDFGWLRASQSPNWCVLPESQRLLAPSAPESADNSALEPSITPTV